MKTELVLKKTILLGFMLMAVSNVFANNANEKENTANVVIKRTINLSTEENPGEPITMFPGQVGDWEPIPEIVGYECFSAYLQNDSPSGCVTLELEGYSRSGDNAIFRLFRLFARYVGTVTLKFEYRPVGEGGHSITLAIEVRVR